MGSYDADDYKSDGQKGQIHSAQDFIKSFKPHRCRSRTFPAIAWEIGMRQQVGQPDAQMSKNDKKMVCGQLGHPHFMETAKPPSGSIGLAVGC